MKLAEVFWGIVLALLYFVLVFYIKAPLIIQILFFLLPLLLAIKYSIRASFISFILMTIIFLHKNPPSRALIPYYVSGTIFIILLLILGDFLIRLREDEKKIEALYEGAQIISTARSLEELTERTVSILKESLGYAFVGIAWIKSKGLELYYGENYIVEKGFKIELGEGITGTAVKERKTILVNDVKKALNYIPGLPDAKSELAVPIILRGKAVGVINLESQKKSAFSEKDIRLIESLAKMVAVAWENVNLYEKLLNESISDPLTGLYNRRYILRRLKEEMERRKRYGGNFAVIMFDLENFKSINDTYGHEKGDEVLKLFAENVKDKLRKSDLFARYGGDEFLAVLMETKKEGALAVAKRIASSLENLKTPDGIKVKANMGIAVYPDDGKTPQELINKADERMYKAKKEGKPFLDF